MPRVQVRGARGPVPLVFVRLPVSLREPSWLAVVLWSGAGRGRSSGTPRRAHGPPAGSEEALMAGLPWIKVWTAVRDHPKVQRLERELGVKDGLGIVVRLWCWTADYHPGGEMPEADGNTAAKAARGDATKRSPDIVLAALVGSGLLDRIPGGFRVHDWDDMQTKHVEAEEHRRALAAERQARWRDRHGVTSNGKRNASRNGDVTHPSVTEREREIETEIRSRIGSVQPSGVSDSEIRLSSDHRSGAK